MMEIVIKIPEDTYKDIIESEHIEHGFIWDEDKEAAIHGIQNGTPLPKGHGDLVDINEVIKSLFAYHNGKKTIGQCIDDIQTIIEAEGSESE